MRTGFLNIDKPSGPTSHDIVDAIRRITGVRTVGHAGTLDPFASGVLIVGVGREATKKLDRFKEMPKTYHATLRLGATADTYDRTGKMQVTSHKSRVTQNEIENILKYFVGEIEQIPPMFSAKKIGGKKLYELAREGKTIERNPIKISIHSIRLIRVISNQRSTSNDIKSVIIEVTCSPGTYIRTLAHDIGQRLGCGAYCEELIRTAIGSYTLDEATTIDKLTPQTWHQYLTMKPEARSQKPEFGKNIRDSGFLIPDSIPKPIRVLVFGTFDRLHPGHLDFFRQAKALGTHLIVGVGRDTVVHRIKGKLPRNNETARKNAVENCGLTNEVLLLSENPAERFSWIKRINPDVIALGYDQAAFTETLSDDLVRHGIQCSIVRLKPYRPETYKSSKIP